MAKTQDLHEIAVIIPSFNEGARVVETIKQLQNTFPNLIVVDDGSSDKSFESIVKTGVIALRHSVNLGQGAAIQTGIEYGLTKKEIEYFLTFDADGQHSLEFALYLVEEIRKNEVDVVLGSRFLNANHSESLPQKKKLVLKLGILFTRFDTGLKVTDTHNGLRAMSRKFCEELNIKQNGMAHASEILSAIKDGSYTWKEMPVQVIYTDYSKAKGQSILNAINIITEMFHR